ncbi:serine/threonine protein kinase [Sulfolobus sp. A20]|uniref:protein kinase domain-containing protein n=1 Tax=Saccharolobus sp. A20 TaxID=1891280 RepID=UPI000845ED06|nr:protein kinase [Sulfolobus sp. A20]TRM76844.1 serine/threonine protein kinase [Sulfolobus sp. E5]TRM77252.1 serine/threonine protein kinase [Sulfolobus sp. A20-N-F8]TRM84257.1 serine/threonine protein kinase [Sulfolobus sp. A20-N-F6]TRM87208.1 serine/threonine protein kinase [Sulfolobus sp. E3]TRN04744.1 serine/threonine protein kinase [Sulfolobus sp. E1]
MKTSNVLRYITGFLGFPSLIYAIILILQRGLTFPPKLIIIADLGLLFFSLLALTYTFTQKILIEKPFAIFFAIILVYLTFYSFLPIQNKIFLLMGAIIETQLASRRGIGGTIYTILDVFMMSYFVYNYLLSSSLLSLLGVGLTSLSIVLANRDRGIRLISYVTFPLSIPLLVFSLSSILLSYPLGLNIVGLAVGVLLLLSAIFPIRSKKAKLDPSILVKDPQRFKQNLCKEINKSDCNKSIELYKNYMIYIPQKCIEKVIQCCVFQNDINTFRLIIGSPSNVQIIEKYIDRLTPEMLYELAIQTNKESLLELACKKGFSRACSNEHNRPLDINNWDEKVWLNKEIHGYKVIEIMGIGGTSYVLKGEREGKLFALKIPLPKYLNNIVDIVGESSKLIELSSKSLNIVRLFAIYADQNDIKSILSGDYEYYVTRPPLLVVELMEGGSIDSLIRNPNLIKDIYWKKLVILVSAKMAEALEIVHSEGYVHCDVKPQNILFSEKLPSDLKSAYERIRGNNILVKLADLGSAVRAGQKPFSYTPAYAPFDLIKASVHGGVSPTVDVYSLGATIYKLLTLSSLNSPEMIKAMEKYELNKDENLLDYKLYDTRRLNILKRYIDSDIANFIITMVDPDPSKRPTSKEVKEFFYSKA